MIAKEKVAKLENELGNIDLEIEQLEATVAEINSCSMNVRAFERYQQTVEESLRLGLSFGHERFQAEMYVSDIESHSVL